MMLINNVINLIAKCSLFPSFEIKENRTVLNHHWIAKEPALFSEEKLTKENGLDFSLIIPLFNSSKKYVKT